MQRAKLNIERFLERHNVENANQVADACVHLVDAKRTSTMGVDKTLALVLHAVRDIALDHELAHTMSSWVDVGPNVEIYIGHSETSDNEHIADIIVDRSEKTLYLCWIFPQTE